jgi:hypothetical protein
MNSSANKVQVYVRLLNEGTEVFRPTLAVELGEGLFQLLATLEYDPEDEEWEILPDATVRITMYHGSSGDLPLAVRP